MKKLLIAIALLMTAGTTHAFTETNPSRYANVTIVHSTHKYTSSPLRTKRIFRPSVKHEVVGKKNLIKLLKEKRAKRNK